MKKIGKGTGMGLNDLAQGQKREGSFQRVFGFDILHLDIQIENEVVPLRGAITCGRDKENSLRTVTVMGEVDHLENQPCLTDSFFRQVTLREVEILKKEISGNEFFSPYGIASTRREPHIFQKKIKTTTKSRARMKYVELFSNFLFFSKSISSRTVIPDSPEGFPRFHLRP